MARRNSVASLAFGLLLFFSGARLAHGQCLAGGFNSFRGYCSNAMSQRCWGPSDCYDGCSTHPCQDYPKRPNVILFIVDDLWWADFPQFGTPIKWPTLPNSMLDLTARDELRIQRPDLNRLAARVLATQPPISTSTTNPFVPFGTFTPPGGTAFQVVPQDPLNDGFTVGHCKNGCGDSAQYRHDILEGFGGLNRIAQKGAVFSRYHAPTTYCGPARATIFTGRHTKRHGVGSNGGAEVLNVEVTIPEWLRQFCDEGAALNNPKPPYLTGFAAAQAQAPDSTNCYQTMLIGKWHGGHSRGSDINSGSAPWKQGFKVFAGHLGGAVRGYFSNHDLICFPANQQGTGAELPGCQGPDGGEGSLEVYGGRDRAGTQPCNDDGEANTNIGICGCTEPAHCDDIGNETCVNGVCQGSVCNANKNCPSGDCVSAPNSCSYSTRAYAKLATEFIGRNVSKPFFLVVSFNAVHTPQTAPDRTIEHYQQNYPPRGRERGRNWWPALEEIDAAVGKVVAKLDATGLRDKTILMVTGDHGGPHHDYGIPMLNGGKGGNTEGGTRVGLLANACNQDLQGQRDQLGQHVANHADLFATIAEAAGMQLGSPGSGQKSYIVDGQSFYPLLLSNGSGGSDAFVRNFTFSRYYTASVASRQSRYVSAGSGDGVCGFAKPNSNGVIIRGGSCSTCDAVATGDVADSSCGDKVCKVVGKVCVSKPASGGLGQCVDETGAPQHDPPQSCTKNTDFHCDLCDHSWNTAVDPATLHRCVSDADCTNPEGAPDGPTVCDDENHPCVCADIAIQCSHCMRPAWKLYQNQDPEAPATALYDLTTNPEEEKVLNCVKKDAEIGAVRADLKCRARGWLACTSEDTNAMNAADRNNTPCDRCYDQSSAPCGMAVPFTGTSCP